MSHAADSREGTLALGASVLLLVATVILIAPGMVGAAETDQADSNVTIDSEVATADGEIQVLVELSEPAPPEGAVSTKDYTTQLQTHATQSQTDLLQFINRTEGLTVERQFWIVNAVGVTIDTNTVDPKVLTTVENVERVSAEVTVERLTGTTISEGQTVTESGLTPHNTSGPADTTTYETTWGVSRVGAPAVWNRFDSQGEGMTVAVLDTGVNESHPDIELGEDGWNDFVNDTETPYDNDGHGTHVSGTVAGTNASGEWIGVAPEATLIHGQVFGSDGLASGFDILSGIEWAVEEDADVLSMSLGGDTSDFFVDAIENSNQAGTVVVASIGNDGEGTSGSPGNYYSTIGVGAITPTDTVGTSQPT